MIRYIDQLLRRSTSHPVSLKGRRWLVSLAILFIAIFVVAQTLSALRDFTEPDLLFNPDGMVVWALPITAILLLFSAIETRPMRKVKAAFLVWAAITLLDHSLTFDQVTSPNIYTRSLEEDWAFASQMAIFENNAAGFSLRNTSEGLDGKIQFSNIFGSDICLSITPLSPETARACYASNRLQEARLSEMNGRSFMASFHNEGFLSQLVKEQEAKIFYFLIKAAAAGTLLAGCIFELFAEVSPFSKPGPRPNNARRHHSAHAGRRAGLWANSHRHRLNSTIPSTEE
ncbi:hypothetical protein ACFSM5_21055 [Lacibacterium aquatile]|uniref:DUF805 domain-containing protein n=1 Tax=Lacibacterium aquatile TaxID=1168082 RepID=A0ABW5E1P9_9PROT